MDLLLQYGLAGVLAFGLVGVCNMFYQKKWGKEIPNDIKLYLLVAFAFIAGFIPSDLGNVIFNHLKEAIAIALGVHAAWTGLTSVGKKA